MKKPIVTLGAALMSICLCAQPVSGFSVLCADANTVIAADSDAVSETAFSKMNDFNTILAVLNASPLYTEDTEDENFARITDSRFKTYDDVCDFIKATVSGKLREELLEEASTAVVLIGDKPCVRRTGRSFYQFRTDEGVTITQKTDVTFTATTVTSDDLYGRGQAFFILKDGEWYIDFYQFGADDVKADDIIGKWVIKTFESSEDNFILFPIKKLAFDFKSGGTGAVTGTVNGTDKSVDMTWSLEGTTVRFKSADVSDKTYTMTYDPAAKTLLYTENANTSMSFVRLDSVLGDPNADSKIDAKDASFVLAEYSIVSTGGADELSWLERASADVNQDDKIDAKDASAILSYYSMVSTAAGDVPTLLEYVAPKEK